MALVFTRGTIVTLHVDTFFKLKKFKKIKKKLKKIKKNQELTRGMYCSKTLTI